MIVRDTYGIQEHKHKHADYWHVVTKHHWYEHTTVTTDNQGTINITHKVIE